MYANGVRRMCIGICRLDYCVSDMYARGWGGQCTVLEYLHRCVCEIDRGRMVSNVRRERVSGRVSGGKAKIE